MKQRLCRQIRAQRLWLPGERVAIAVSGGSDSVALAGLLVATRGVHGGVLTIVHVDHGLSPHSKAWCAQVERLAHGWALPFELCSVRPSSASETAARTARFAALDAVDTDVVALAHHRDDQAETVLLHLLRGTLGRGLRGMLARRGRYVRPLLWTDRASLTDWRRAQGLPAVEDPANLDPIHLRTRLRHELLPLLEDLREGSAGVLARLAERQAEDDAWLETQAESLSLSALGGAPRALARRRIRQLLSDPEGKRVDAVLNALVTGGTVDLGGGRQAVVRNGGVSIVDKP